MLIGSIIGWIFAGLIVGAVARLLMPGQQNMGIIMTILLGIVGAMLAGFVGSFIFGPNLVTDGERVYEVRTAWPGYIMAVVGAFAVLWLYISMSGRNRTL